jgi:hypothetical protein
MISGRCNGSVKRPHLKASGLTARVIFASTVQAQVALSSFGAGSQRASVTILFASFFNDRAGQANRQAAAVGEQALSFDSRTLTKTRREFLLAA